jgi:seryl-tRNA synthetase
VDEVIALDIELRKIKQEAEALRADRNRFSKQIGGLMAQGKKEEAEVLKEKVNANSETLARLEIKEDELNKKVKDIMMTIPNIIDPSVPLEKTTVKM